MVAPNESGLDIQIEGGPTRDTIYRILRAKIPKQVTAEGKPLDQHASVTVWEKSRRGWWFDAADQRLWIRLADVKDTRVTIAD